MCVLICIMFHKNKTKEEILILPHVEQFIHQYISNMCVIHQYQPTVLSVGL